MASVSIAALCSHFDLVIIDYRFCAGVGLGEPTKVFYDVDVQVLEKFLEWTICQKFGKNGRKKRGTKTSGALYTRWKNLQIVYKVAIGKKFNAKIYDEMIEVSLADSAIFQYANIVGSTTPCCEIRIGHV